jgi:hypothetical protein
MVSDTADIKNSAVGNEGHMAPHSPDHRTILRNFLTGKRQRVLLFDPADFNKLQSEGADLELHADIAKALSQFSPLEKRIILRVLVQGQSVREATKSIKGSRSKWASWLRTYAVPVMQKALEDYAEELRRYGAEVQAQEIDIEAPVTESDDNTPAKCKVSECGATLPSFKLLKKHYRENHRATFAKVQRFVQSGDYELQRAEMTIRKQEGMF